MNDEEYSDGQRVEDEEMDALQDMGDSYSESQGDAIARFRAEY